MAEDESEKGVDWERRPRHWKRKLEAIRQEYQAKANVRQNAGVAGENRNPPIAPVVIPDPVIIPPVIQLSRDRRHIIGHAFDAITFLWLALFSWQTIAVLVPSLWAFSTLMLQVGTPTFVEVFAGEVMFITANIFLLARIVWSIHQSELGRLGGIIAAMLTLLVVGFASVAGVVYGHSKNPPDLSGEAYIVNRTVLDLFAIRTMPGKS